jgi:ankyrin repeat protein
LLDADAGLVNRLPEYVTYYNGLPLRNAAAAGHMEVVKLLLERGANVNEPEPGIAPFGGALHSAVGGRHWAIAKLLLERGSDPVATVESSGDVLHMARVAGASPEVLEMIESAIVACGRSRDKDVVAYEADVTVLTGLLAVNPSAPVEHYLGRLIGEDLRQQLEMILRYQPDIFRRQTMLSAAWWDGSTFKSAEQARWILEQGFDPRLSNWLGITMLHRCAAKGLIDVAGVLLEYGAEIDAVDAEWRETPLGWAVRHGRGEMVEWLKARGGV